MAPGGSMAILDHDIFGEKRVYEVDLFSAKGHRFQADAKPTHKWALSQNGRPRPGKNVTPEFDADPGTFGRLRSSNTFRDKET